MGIFGALVLHGIHGRIHILGHHQQDGVLSGGGPGALQLGDLFGAIVLVGVDLVLDIAIQGGHGGLGGVLAVQDQHGGLLAGGPGGAQHGAVGELLPVKARVGQAVQGEGGVMALEQDFVDAIYDRCAKRDILVMTDEVQTGMGRTGTLLAGEQFGHHADVVTLAKGIAGGLPMGACLANEKCSGVLDKSSHGSTFGGNPVCCAGGLAVLQTLTADGFLASVQEKAAYLREKLAKLPHVQAVTGLGLMVGIQLDADKKAIDVVNAALEQGLLLLTAKDRVRLLPPLTISKDELDRGVAILADVLSK